jgi:4-amino-4-deoxy-L-arabinose transferase-like glycosyltransferase
MRRDLLVLFLLAAAVRFAAAVFVRQPGYMDVSYYSAGARQLAAGGGLTENFLWNYLDDPAGLPHPGFLYWMPLPALLAAPAVALLGRSFLAAQLPFVLLSALLPLVGYTVAWRTTGVRRHAWAVGLLTLFSGFFFSYWTLPETFAPFAVFGSLALWLSASRSGRLALLAAGACAGLAHLTRADGVLLLPVALLGVGLTSWRRGAGGGPGVLVRSAALVLLGYLLVTAPWFARNLAVTGAPLPAAGTKTLWLTTYDDLYCYRCDLSPRSYLAWGWGNIVDSKLAALWINFQRFLAEDCLVFLFPFLLIGLYRLRRRPPFILAFVYLLLLYAVHSLAFTFPGWRGGFFHSSAALLPFLFTAGLEGLDAAIALPARRRRGWNTAQARRFFTVAVVVLAAIMSITISVPIIRRWNQTDRVYDQIGAWLAANAPAGATVMVGNPPSFWYHTGRPAVVVPNSDPATLLAVCDRYNVAYVILDANRPVGLADLYAGAPLAGLEQVATFADGQVRLYRVQITN